MEQDKVTLIDTSFWVEALRALGKENIRKKVINLMVDGKAAWCDMVTLELWNGARGDYEKQKLKELEREITCLQINREVWDMARMLAQKCRFAGKTVPSSDLLITACALFHNAEIEHCDTHIDFILSINA